MPETRRRKSGPKNGVYENILATHKGNCPPLPNEMRYSNPRKYNRIKAARALWRRRHEAGKYKKFAAFVRALRKRTGKSQPEFARLLGVSTVTITRWENGYGHMPSPWKKKVKRGVPEPSTMERLQNLDRMTKDFKRKKLKLED